MAKKRITAYWLLLLAFLMLGNLVLSVGQTQARYTDDMLLLNTVAEPAPASVTSDCLADVSEAPLTVLLGSYDQANSLVAFTMYTDADVSGNLQWTSDKADYLAAELSVDGTPLDAGGGITLLKGETLVSMTLLPTELAAALEEDLTVHITVTWNDTLRGTFRVILPAAQTAPVTEEETEPEEEIPTEPEEETPSEPEEEIPTDSAEGEPAPATETESPVTEEPSVTEAKAVISGSKILLGRSLNENEFTFHLYETGSDYLIPEDAQPIGTAVNDAQGAFTFAELVFTEAGDHYYVVAEDASAKLGGITYDTKTFMVHVAVADNEGQLDARMTIIDAADIEFTNIYSPAATTFTISGIKRLSGALLQENMFTFLLYDADEDFNPLGDPISTAQNNADGAFAFDELTYTWDTVYRYVVVEDRPDDQGQITYDTRRYGITVTVTDDGAGQLAAVGVLSRVDGEPAEAGDTVMFSNIYTPAEGETPVIRLDTIGSFDSQGLLPVKLTWLEGVERIRLSMTTMEGTGEDFPRFTRYSLDGGESYEMLYYGGTISIDASAGAPFLVLLDLSHAQLPVTVETIESTDETVPPMTVARTADVVLTAQAYAGDWLVSQTTATAKPELDGCYEMASSVLNHQSPLQIRLPEGWKNLNLEYSVKMLTLPVLSEEELTAGAVAAAEYVDLAQPDPEVQSLVVTHTADDTGHTLTLATGETLPVPGTYRLDLNWMYEGICFEGTQITFFINYSVEQTQTVTGGAEQ